MVPARIVWIEGDFMHRLTLSLLLFVLLVCTPLSALADPPDREEVSRQATAFVELMDRGDDDACWRKTSTLFQALNDRENWPREQGAIRMAYGSPLSRTLHRIDFRTTYSGSPDGSYVIVQLRSTFERKARAIETIVLDCSISPCLVREYKIN
jgi:hypothetical protein